MKTIILILKGFIIGLAKVIPGVSGAVLAISMGLYDKAINAITEFFSDVKNNILFLVPIGIGVVLAMVIGSNIVSYTLSKYYVITMLFFIGLIMGSVPTIYNKINKSKKGIILVIISFISMFVLSISSIDNTYVIKNNIIDYFMYFISGIIDAVGTVVPGVSSTALLMILGTYEIIINVIASITDIDIIINNFKILSMYTIGMGLGIIVVSLIINYLFKKHNSNTYSFIFGIILSSILLLFIKTISYGMMLKDILIGLILLVLGMLITKLVGD